MKGQFSRLLLAGFSLVAAGGALSATVDKPGLVDRSNLTVKPYRDTGFVYIQTTNGTYVGSGYLVNNRAAITAAHVIYDTENLAWRTGIKFQRAFNNNYQYADGASMAGATYMESYSTALKAFMATSEYSEGTQDGPTFNSDVAVIYTVQSLASFYGNYQVSRYGESFLACEQWSMLLLGYPTDNISASYQGFMHQTGPSNWSLVDAYGNNDGTASVDSVHAALIKNEGEMVVYGGNSGGPLFVYDEDDDSYLNIGEVLGGDDNEATAYTYFRTIDENTLSLVTQAIASSGAESDLSPTTISASGTKAAVTLGWYDSATNETGWQIRRNDGNGWSVIATADANATSYTDTTAETGIAYQYEIRAVQNLSSDINKGPWSNRASASRSGVVPSKTLANALGAPYLYVTSDGDAPFHASADGASVTSGEILNYQDSALEVKVVGPGTLTYSISTSSEAGYDKVSVTLDGDAVAIPLSGTNGYTTKSVDIPSSGNHVVAFTYAKDMYSTGGDDQVQIKNMSYFSTNSSEALQGGVVTTGDWHYSAWLGHYYDYGNHWIYSYNLGYVYVSPVSSSGWTNDKSLWVYFDQSSSGYPAIGWAWIGLDFFPDIWSSNLGWLYYYEGTNWVQKYSDNGWIKL